MHSTPGKVFDAHTTAMSPGDRTYKLGSGITSEYGRYVKSLGEPVTGAPFAAAPQVRFLVRMTYSNEAIRTCMYPCIDGVTL